MKHPRYEKYVSHPERGIFFLFACSKNAYAAFSIKRKTQVASKVHNTLVRMKCLARLWSTSPQYLHKEYRCQVSNT